MKFNADTQMLTDSYLIRRHSDLASNRIPYINTREVFAQNWREAWTSYWQSVLCILKASFGARSR